MDSLMRVGLVWWMAVAACVTLARGGDAPHTYTNPLPVDIADPYVLKDGDTYYLYGTTDVEAGFRAWKSRDLVQWDTLGFVFHKTDLSWGRQHFWAPCVVRKDGAYYLFYNAVGRGVSGRHGHRICVARSDSPQGPFVDIAAPLLDVNQSTIDADVLVDVDGRVWLYYSLDVSENPVSAIHVVELSADLSRVISEPVLCVSPSQEWEGPTWNEAPFVFRHEQTGKYVLMYSGRGYFEPLYSVGYATADRPQGPWVKSSRNPILTRSEKVSGPGHNSVVPGPDGRELFIAYHTHKSLAGGDPRHLALDRLTIQTVDGRPSVVPLTPTLEPQPLPGARR